MTDANKSISDDLSNTDDAPSSPPIIPAGVSKLPTGSHAGVYAPTSDKKPSAHPDPLQRRGCQSAPLQPSAGGIGERLFSERALQHLH
jgi:hypothetical protein